MYSGDFNQQVVTLGVQLVEVGVRNTATAILDKIRAIKSKRNDQETINELEEIVNSLIADKNELTQIAEAYKQELVAQQISQEEIEYITQSFIPILKELIQQASSGDNAIAAANMEQTLDIVARLLSVEVLTVLQLVGFNFKKAIGEPLTLLLQKVIMANVPIDQQGTAEYNKLLMIYNIEMLKVAQDKDAYARWEQLRSS